MRQWVIEIERLFATFLYFSPKIMVQGQNKVAIADLGCKARLHR